MFGFCSIAIGVNFHHQGIRHDGRVLAILVGFAIGHSLHLEHGPASSSTSWCALSISAVALFCCSGFGWYSTLTEGITGDPSLLMSKAVLDGFTAMIFASTLGQPSALSRCPRWSSCSLCSEWANCWPVC